MIVKRIAALFIDALILFPLIFLEIRIQEYLDSYWAYIYSYSWFSMMYIMYNVYLHYRFGQTVGKMAMSIRVVNHPVERKITFKQSLLRDSPYIVVSLLTIMSFWLLILLNVDYRFETIELVAGYIFLAWNLLEFVVMVMHPKYRALHDLIANTVVV